MIIFKNSWLVVFTLGLSSLFGANIGRGGSCRPTSMSKTYAAVRSFSSSRSKSANSSGVSSSKVSGSSGGLKNTKPSSSSGYNYSDSSSSSSSSRRSYRHFHSFDSSPDESIMSMLRFFRWILKVIYQSVKFVTYYLFYWPIKQVCKAFVYLSRPVFDCLWSQVPSFNTIDLVAQCCL